MSEWREWPLLTGRTVPFATSERGGQLKAIGNPGVWWPAAFLWALSLALGVAWTAVHGVSLCKRAVAWVDARVEATTNTSSQKARQAPKALAARVSAAGTSSSAPASAPASVPETDRPVPFWIAFVTLWFGYAANVVPYEMITRSKFIYHGVPMLMVGVLLVALCVEYAITWARADGAIRRVPVTILTLALYAGALAGFYYWGVPYVYGFPLSPAQHAARRWHPKW